MVIIILLLLFFGTATPKFDLSFPSAYQRPHFFQDEVALIPHPSSMNGQALILWRASVRRLINS